MPYRDIQSQMWMEWTFIMFELENWFVFGKISDFYYTSRLSNHNGEICLQKHPPISGKLSITNYVKYNAIDIKAI